jgi:hypothetical protein
MLSGLISHLRTYEPSIFFMECSEKYKREASLCGRGGWLEGNIEWAVEIALDST